MQSGDATGACDEAQSARVGAAVAVGNPRLPYVDKTEIAGAGFINFHLLPSAKLEIVRAVLEQGAAFGRSTAGGRHRKMQVEFVSANPTGPLHVGHGRGAAYGASLSNLLAYAGWDVTREYYVNDAGRQMDILAVSGWLRYLDLYKEALPFPPNAYQATTCARWRCRCSVLTATSLCAPRHRFSKERAGPAGDGSQR